MPAAQSPSSESADPLAAFHGPPPSIGIYLERTSAAARHCYLGIAACDQIFQEAQAFSPPEESFTQQPDGWHRSVPIKTELQRVNLDRSLRRYEHGFDHAMAVAINAGGILQLAATAIVLYSRNDIMPDDCSELLKGIKIPSRAKKFLIGRREKGIPEGLLVYVGRNQYSHWEEKGLHPIAERVFSVLDEWHYMNSNDDLAFARGSTGRTIFADNFLFKTLRWHTYRDYVIGMRRLLEPFDPLGKMPAKERPINPPLADALGGNELSQHPATLRPVAAAAPHQS